MVGNGRLAVVVRAVVLARGPRRGVGRGIRVNGLRKELTKQGYVFTGQARGRGLLFRNYETGESVRIMERPRTQFRNDSRQKHYHDFYYRYRPRNVVKEWKHVTIPNKK